VGVNYIDRFISPELSLGLETQAVTVTQIDGAPKLAIADTTALNDQGKALGFENGDAITKINGEVVPYNSEFQEFFGRQQQSLQEGKKLSYTVLRKNEAGEQKEVELAADVIIVDRVVKHLLGMNDQATPEQLELRKAWITE
jgi:hypothetical protein